MAELSVDIKANAQQAISQTKALSAAFQDTASDMEKLVDAGQDLGKSTDDIARDISKVSGRPFEDVKREVEKAERSIDDMADEADDARKALDKVGDAGDDAGDKTNRGMDKAKSGLDDFKSEASQTARESAASFDGSAESIGDAFQEVAANAFGGFGPLGAAAGIAVAAGIGLGVAGFDDIQEKAKETEERIAEMYNDMLESGQAYLSASFIQNALSEIGSNTEKYNQALQISKDLNIDINDVVRAMAGDQTALSDVISIQTDKRKEELDAIKTSGASLEDQAVKVDAVNTKYGEQNDIFNDIIGSQDSAASRFETINAAQSAYLLDLIANAGDAAVQVDELGNKIVEIPGEVPIFVDAQTGQATTNVSNFKGDVNSVPKTVTTTLQAVVDDSAFIRFRDRVQNTVLKVPVESAPMAGSRNWEG